MIEVSGLQQQKEGADPRSARRFAFETAEKLSKLPMYIAMLLTGIAVYFKTAMPARADASVEPESEPGPLGSESGGAPIDFGRATAARPDAVSSVEENRERPDRLEPLDFVGQAPNRGNVIDFPSPMKLMKVGNPFGLDTLPLIEAATPSFGLSSAPANATTPTGVAAGRLHRPKTTVAAERLRPPKMGPLPPSSRTPTTRRRAPQRQPRSLRSRPEPTQRRDDGASGPYRAERTSHERGRR